MKNYYKNTKEEEANGDEDGNNTNKVPKDTLLYNTDKNCGQKVVNKMLKRKRQTCRKQFRHKDITLYKLGGNHNDVCHKEENVQKNFPRRCSNLTLSPNHNTSNGSEECHDSLINVINTTVTALEGNYNQQDLKEQSSLRLHLQNNVSTAHESSDHITRNLVNKTPGKHVLPFKIPERRSSIAEPLHTEQTKLNMVPSTLFTYLTAPTSSALSKVNQNHSSIHDKISNSVRQEQHLNFARKEETVSKNTLASLTQKTFSSIYPNVIEKPAENCEPRLSAFKNYVPVQSNVCVSKATTTNTSVVPNSIIYSHTNSLNYDTSFEVNNLKQKNLSSNCRVNYVDGAVPSDPFNGQLRYNYQQSNQCSQLCFPTTYQNTISTPVYVQSMDPRFTPYNFTVLAPTSFTNNSLQSLSNLSNDEQNKISNYETKSPLNLKTITPKDDTTQDSELDLSKTKNKSSSSIITIDSDTEIEQSRDSKNLSHSVGTVLRTLGTLTSMVNKIIDKTGNKMSTEDKELLHKLLKELQRNSVLSTAKEPEVVVKEEDCIQLISSDSDDDDTRSVHTLDLSMKKTSEIQKALSSNDVLKNRDLVESTTDRILNLIEKKSKPAVPAETIMRQDSDGVINLSKRDELHCLKEKNNASDSGQACLNMGKASTQNHRASTKSITFRPYLTSKPTDVELQRKPSQNSQIVFDQADSNDKEKIYNRVHKMSNNKVEIRHPSPCWKKPVHFPTPTVKDYNLMRGNCVEPDFYAPPLSCYNNSVSKNPNVPVNATKEQQLRASSKFKPVGGVRKPLRKEKRNQSYDKPLFYSSPTNNIVYNDSNGLSIPSEYSNHYSFYRNQNDNVDLRNSTTGHLSDDISQKLIPVHKERNKEKDVDDRLTCPMTHSINKNFGPPYYDHFSPPLKYPPVAQNTQFPDLTKSPTFSKNFFSSDVPKYSPTTHEKRLYCSSLLQPNDYDRLLKILPKLHLDNTLTPEQYVLELHILERDGCPRPFLDFYSYVTKKQIAGNQKPVCFRIFLEFQNAGKLIDFESAFKIYSEKRESEKLALTEK